MSGVQFVVDGTGRKTGVVIDLRKNPEVWEDLFDRALLRKFARSARRELEALETHLVTRI